MSQGESERAQLVQKDGSDSESSEDEGNADNGDDDITQRARDAIARSPLQATGQAPAADNPVASDGTIAQPPVAMNLADLSERSKEAAELRVKLAEVQAQVGAADGGAASLTKPAAAPLSPLLQAPEAWDELQSAHAHMLLLEARLSELAGGNSNQ